MEAHIWGVPDQVYLGSMHVVFLGPLKPAKVAVSACISKYISTMSIELATLPEVFGGGTHLESG